MDLYFAETPYHILLATSHARYRGGNSILVVRTETGGARQLTRALDTTDSSPFDNVRFLSNGLDNDVTGRKIKRYRAVLSMLRQTAHSRIETVYFFNDRFLSNQFLLYWLERTNSNIQMIEDGAAAYSELTYEPKYDTPKWLPNRLLFGPWWRSVEVLGTSGYATDIWLTHPDHARPELDRLTQHQLPATFNTADLEWVKDTLNYLGATIPNSFEAVVMAPHSSIVDDESAVRRHLQSILAEQGQSLSSAVVKYHPREPHDDYLDLESYGGNTIQRDIPAELLYLAGVDLATIIGGNTTALLSANWMLDDVDIVFVPFEGAATDNRFQRIMDTIGHPIPV